MKVLIEIEVPDKCSECPLFYVGQIRDYCQYPTNRPIDPNVAYERRPDDCPLNTVRNVVLGKMVDDNGIGCRFKITDEYKLVSLEVKTDETS